MALPMADPAFDALKAAYEQRVRLLDEEIEKRERALRILSAVAERLHGEDSVPGILDIALEEILGQLGLKAAWIFTGDQRDRTLQLTAARGVSQAYLKEVLTEGLGECLCPEVFWTGHRMLARNTVQCPRMPDIVEGLKAPVAHACVPLKFEDTTRGVLNVAARPGEFFSDDELRFLEILGRHVVLAVERARHRAAERLRYQEARAMATISKAIGGSLDLNAILKGVGETARELLEADRVAIFLGSDPTELRVAYLSGSHPVLVEGDSIDLVAQDARLQLQALSEGRAQLMHDRRTDPRTNRELAERWDAGSAIVAPLVAHDRTFGLLLLTCSAPRAHRPEQVEVAEALGAQAAVALENARLYDEARRALRDLKAAQERIIQNEKMAVLGTFASGLAHEVRNPLNSITLQLSILERRIARTDASVAPEMAKLVTIIREEIRRLDALVGDFLLFSRPSRIAHRPGDLEALTDEVVQLLAPEAAQAGVTLHRRALGAPVRSLRMDAEKMKQVVLNLVRNAIEAMPEGGAVFVETGTVGGQARLAVRDTGPGLPEGMDVFQLFATTKPGGTGLGLSIVQQIVLQHGGEVVAASSAEGGGAVFTVSLPLEPTEPRQEGVAS
jgi:signal transduction histidine kinase